MIKISILTCTYNSESTIDSTLQSVLSQDYPAVEHIIVDGASKDSTLKKAEEYKRRSDSASSGHEVVILSEPDDGLYFAMNKALQMASGDYVVYLNAGDFLPDSRVIADIADCAMQTDRLPGVIYGDTDLVDSAGRFVRHRRLSPPKHLTWKSFADGMLVCHQAFYALTSLAREVPYNIDYRYSADVDWCIRVMKVSEREGRSLRNVGRVVVNYLSEGMTTKNHNASLSERFRVMRSHYGLPLTLWKHFFFVIRAVFKR
jgi:glycosyltransferase involved in cell wall biosynthesis